MESYHAFLSLGVALFAGLLIGLEREQSAPDDPAERRREFQGGVRTHPLIALSGALSSLLSLRFGLGVVLGGLAILGLFLVLAYLESVKRERELGLTSEVAFVISYLLGVLSTATGVVEPVGRRAILTMAIAVVVTLLLSAKPRLHKLADRVSKEDMYATLKFLIIAVVVLPLLPDRTYGPLAVLNPFKIGLMIVLIAGVDFFGYVAVRVLGAGRGLGIMGLLGGLASSTAVTLSVSNRAKEEPKLASAYALAAVMASSVMAPRVLVMIALIHPPLVAVVGPPLVAIALGGAASSYVLYRRSREKKAKSADFFELHNPFELGAALKWGAIFTVVLFVTKFAYLKLGQTGTYAAGLLSGTTDVDAITLSMGGLTRSGEVAAPVAVTTILLAIASNTIVKGTMATVIGGWAYGKLVLSAFGAMLGAGALGLVWVWLSS
jgi:uncharacterized membrane protein (DUF4010 family)